MQPALSAAPTLGLYAIAPTLFTAGGAAVDGNSMARAAEWMASQGVNDLLLTGSYGEFQSLTDEERVSVLRAVRAVTAVRSVMACAALPSTEATARLASRLFDEGANEVMVSAPLVAEVSTAEVFRHFEQLSQRLPGNLVVYNNPVFGIDLSPADLDVIASLPGIVAVKQGTSSLRGLAESIAAVHRGTAGMVRVLAASDVTAVLALVAGADGVTSTNSWAFPQAMVELVSAAARSDWDHARRIAVALEPYFSLVRRLGQPRTVKAAMQLRGLPGTDDVRLPYLPLDDSERKALRGALADCDSTLTEVRLAGQGRAGSRE